MAPTKKLNDQAHIPVLGFGTWQLEGQTCTDSVLYALKTGYRHIDTADAYNNHAEVAKAIELSEIKRDDIFLTTKIWRTSLAPKDVKSDTERFLNELKTDYIDLLLIHWPNDEVPIEDTISAMKEMKTKHKINAIGISNFTKEQMEVFFSGLEGMVNEPDVSIDNHQFELHPSLYQKDLVQYCFDRHMTISAYSPLAQGQDLKIAEVKDISDKHGISEAQVVLAWIRQRGMIAIARSSDEIHIDDNFASLKVTLPEEDLKTIDNLDTGNRIVRPPFAPFI